MEAELSIPTSLMAEPKKDMMSLGKAQLGFMSYFAMPLFQGVADIIPGMQYCVDELEANRVIFESIVGGEQKEVQTNRMPCWDDNVSPKTTTMDVNHEHREVLSPAPTVLVNRASTEKEFLTHQVSPVDKPSQIPEFNAGYQEVNGITTNFNSVADFAASDPFNVNDCNHDRPGQQRCSETTEGSSVPCSGDWASGPTSATTGKMPLSPSTRGTSVVSRDSTDRPVSVPTTTTTAPSSTLAATESATSEAGPKIEVRRAADVSPGACRSLRKKPSRFRINALPFFRRHKGSSPPVPAADTAG